jgi:CheY-like chemotaxis protein
MKENPARVLCVDSSDRRREKLTSALENLGIEVWAARDLRDALPLVTGLSPDAMVVDEASTQCRRIEWDRLIAQDLKLPALVHSAPANVAGWSALSDFGVVRSEDPEVIVAILTLLLGPRSEANPFGKPQRAA